MTRATEEGSRVFASPRGSDARGARLRARSVADRSPTDPASRDADASRDASAARDASAPSPGTDPVASSSDPDDLDALDGALRQAAQHWRRAAEDLERAIDLDPERKAGYEALAVVSEALLNQDRIDWCKAHLSEMGGR